MHLRCDDGTYLGSGNVPSPEGARPGLKPTLALQHNHVVMQVEYSRRLMGIDTVYQHQFTGDAGSTLAIVHLDTEGHLVEVIDLGNIGRNNPGRCELRDSILYLTGVSNSNIDFGDVTFYASGYEVYIAKYGDTSFMTPYVYTGPHDTGDVRIRVVGDEESWVAYPNPFRQKVNIEIENGELRMDGHTPVSDHPSQEGTGVAKAWLTDMQGRREEVTLTPAGNGKYTLDLTSRPQATYLLTLTTANGKTHTIRLLKQSDIFGR